MRPIQSSPDPDFSLYTDIIDVRSPDEFLDDHVPGAVNLYVLDNAQRVEIGTLYKQVNPFTAKKRGAALVSANIAMWIESYFADKDKGCKPLVYCWRGGQRSNSMATVLTAIGWQTGLIEGGYRQYRRNVLKTLDEAPATLKFIVLAGLTGTAKTALLQQLGAKGEQVLDLEGLANHRGSLLGALPGVSQPSQKYFESLLVRELASFDPARPVWIESESNKVGNVHVPNALWAEMTRADVVEVSAPLEERTRFLIQEYDFLTLEKEELKRRLSFLSMQQGHVRIKEWFDLIDAGAWRALVGSLLSNHYDSKYRASIRRHPRSVIGSVNQTSLSAESLLHTAETLRKIPFSQSAELADLPA